MIKHYTDISGNYLKSWLKGFENAVEDGRFEKIPYGVWRELKRLSDLDKIRFYCDITESGSVYSFKFGLLSIEPKNSDFGKYLENCMLGVEKDKIFSQLNWHSDNNRQPFDKITIDNQGYMYVNGVKQDDSVESLKMNCDGTNTITTKNGMKYDVKDIAKWLGYDDGTLKLTNNPINTVTTVSSVPYSNWDKATNAITVEYGIDSLQKEIDKIVNDLDDLKKVNNTEEKNKMNTNDMFNFDFGPVSDSKIRMSMYGYAIPNSEGKYVAYDVEHERMMDVQILNFNCTGMFYKIPKPIHKVTYGDVVFHNGVPMFVTDIYDDHTRLVAIDPKEGTEKTILPAHSPFGFDYIVTLVSLMDSFDVPADEENPFGNMLPLIMMSNGKTSDQTLPLLFMMNGKMDMDNPLMLMALCGNNLDTNNPLMVMAMMKMFDK